MIVRRAVLAFALMAFIPIAAVPQAQAAGAWVGETVAPTLRQRGWRYVSDTLAPRPTTPVAGSGITRVSWQYHYARWDPALQVALCAAGICVDAASERGASGAFSGLPVATVFRFYFVVAGHGMLPAPLPGGQLQLVVNFD